MHLAAQSSPQRSWADPAGTLKTNLLGLLHLLEAARSLAPGAARARGGQRRGVRAGGSRRRCRSREDAPAAADLALRGEQGRAGLPGPASTPSRSAWPSCARARSTTPAPAAASSFAESSFARQLAEIEAGRRPPRLEVGQPRRGARLHRRARRGPGLLGAARAGRARRGLQRVQRARDQARRPPRRAASSSRASTSRSTWTAQRLRSVDVPVLVGEPRAPARGHRLGAAHPALTDPARPPRPLARTRGRRRRAPPLTAPEARARITDSFSAPRAACGKASRSMTLTRAEARRKLLHIAVGGFALLLRWMTWPEAAAMALAAFLFNWQVLPRAGRPRPLARDGARARLSRRHPPLPVGRPRPGARLPPRAVDGGRGLGRARLRATAWPSLAGQGLGGPRLPWNPRKTWAGFAAFVAFGTAAAAVLTVWTLRLPAGCADRAVAPGVVPRPGARLRARRVAAARPRRQRHRAPGRRARPRRPGLGEGRLLAAPSRRRPRACCRRWA